MTISRDDKLYARAYALSLFTIAFNVVEGGISMLLGYSDETLSLFGFGVDSFIEMVSGMGVAFMVMRIRRNPGSPTSAFEKRALRITGSAFYVLTTGLVAGIVLGVIQETRPETTFWGIFISTVSILTMLWLMSAKKRVGKALNSAAVIADANCTRMCIYMSVVLLLSSILYETTGFAYADLLGAAGLAYLAFGEGREAFEKARGKSCSCEHC